jgi:signal recognition particle receptor subunit beta
MVFFNYATMQMAAKIVYYGPGLCGKTTNLHHIYTKTSPQSRGEMVSLETETDRTLFFDLLPIDVGVIGGFKTRLQLYTVPGQVFYNTTRKLVLKGVDGIVFVADSQRPMLDANIESLKNLRENLGEIGLNMDDMPLVLQLNKRDLPNAAPAEMMIDALDPNQRYGAVESIASNGSGVFETLKLISKLTLRTLRRRMTGEEPPKTRKLAEVASFRVKDDTSASPSRTGAASPLPSAAIGTPPAMATPTFTSPAATAFSGTTSPPQSVQTVRLDEEEPVEEIEPSDEVLAKAASDSADELEVEELSGVPLGQEVAAAEEELPPFQEGFPPSAPAELPATGFAPESEMDFPETEKPAKQSLRVKHVKLRSSVDIMAELEALRKRATQVPPKPRKEPTLSGIPIPVPQPKRDVRHTIVLQADPAKVPSAKSVKVTVSFENNEGVLEQLEQSVELADTSDVRSLALDLKIALE